MSISRKEFLKIAASGGMSAAFGLTHWLPPAWRNGGISLVEVERQSLVMGSVASFKVIAGSEEDGYEAIRQGVAVFRSMDKAFSMYRPDSEMAILARKSGWGSTTLSPAAQQLLRMAKNMYDNTGGMFDITVEPLMRRWGFRDNVESHPVPSDKELKELESLIGSGKLTLEGDRAMLEQAGMALDTGGIAGGYTLDKAIERMRRCDIKAAFINFSGDIHCFGSPEDGGGWPVQIFNPHTGAPRSGVIELNDEALSTSGAYQNRRKKGSRSWGHLLLPGRARPVEPLASLTAIHSSAVIADAWSTAAYVGAAAPADLKVIRIP